MSVDIFTVVLLLAAVGIGVYFYFQYKLTEDKRVREKAAVTKAAADLDDEIAKALTSLTLYMQDIQILVDQYGAADKPADIATRIPGLRLKLDKVSVSPAYLGNCEKLNKYAKALIASPRSLPYMKAYHLGLLLHSFVSLLSTSRLSGFLRSTRLLEEYLTRVYRSRARKKAVDAIDAATADYFDEAAYNIVQTMTAQLKLYGQYLPHFAELQIIVGQVKSGKVNLYVPLIPPKT